MTAPDLPSIPFTSTCRSAGEKKQVGGLFPAWKILTLLGSFVTAAAASQSGNFTYIETNNGSEVTITGYIASPEGPMTIPPTIYDPVTLLNDPVTRIEASAFVSCKELTSVTMSSGVTSIGNSAFSDCSKLTSVSIPASVINIGRSAFSFCTTLTSMSLPNGVAIIGNSAFGTCTALASVTIPSSVTTLGTGVFGNCTSLLTVTIPSSVTAIPTNTFFGCSGLTSVSLPSTLISIGASAFQSCIALPNVSIPPSVTTLKNRAFANCKALTSIAIPANVTLVETEVFRECSSLTSITVDPANPSFGSMDGVMFNTTKSTLIAFPPGRAGDYVLPPTVTSIGPMAFMTCDKLVGVTFPHVLASIEARAFSTCGKLINALFMDDPPASMGFGVFELAGPGFTIGYLKSGTGFTSPEWEASPGQIYTAYHLDAITPEFTWLYSKGVPGNSDFLSDPNGDGVNLLMEYALNLNPNSRNSLQQPVFGTSQMSLSFYAGTPGVSYVVRASDNLSNWTTEGVMLSAPDTNQVRTASVSLASPQRFMRLEVSH